jgi:ORF6N domain
MKQVQLVIKNQHVNLLIKEYRGQRVVTFKDIDELHDRHDGTAKRNFIQNKSHLIEGEDYFLITHSQKDEFRTFEIPNRGLMLITESGYLMLVKSFQDDLAWEVQRKLVNSYFRLKETVDTNQLSPELQMFNKMFNAVAKQEIEAKQLRQEINETNQKVDNITQIVALNPTEWRKKVNSIIKSIAKKLGGYDSYQEIRNESYELLEQRAKCSLVTRLTNKQKKMALEGVSRSKINNVNKMDVIADDQRLTEIYLAIVKEMAIKHQVSYKVS